MTPFIETACVIEHDGQRFESGGAWICDCSDGYRRGVVYADPDKGIVTDWHGHKLANATFGYPFRGGFGAKMRTVRFTIDGVTFAGRYGCDWSQAVRVKSTRKVAAKV